MHSGSKSRDKNARLAKKAAKSHTKAKGKTDAKAQLARRPLAGQRKPSRTTPKLPKAE